MSFPTGTTITTANLDSATDDPSLARADLLSAVQALNSIIASENTASGVLVLTGSGKIPSGLLPSSITLGSGVQIINPTDQVVNIRNFLRLQPQDTTDVENFADAALGDVAFCSDGDSGSPCLAVYDGTDWLRVSLGAAISST
jgi:hypothetical protein